MPKEFTDKEKAESRYFLNLFENERNNSRKKIPGKTIAVLSPEYKRIADGLQPIYQKRFPEIEFYSGREYLNKAFLPLKDCFEYIGKNKITGMEEWRSLTWLAIVSFYPEMLCEVKEI
jgi:hypothetical protein